MSKFIHYFFLSLNFSISNQTWTRKIKIYSILLLFYPSNQIDLELNFFIIHFLNPCPSLLNKHSLSPFLHLYKEKSCYTLVIAHSIHTYFEIMFSKYDLNSRDYGFVWIELIFAETENWKHCSKIIFKCVNSTVRPIFNIFKYVNSATIVREQWFLSLHSKFMWFYCLCTKKKER